MLQIRVAEGLIDYPRGKSAMVHYAYAPSARAAAVGLAAELAGRELWCRHVIEHDAGVDLSAFFAKTLREFVQRFGTEPRS